MRGEVRMLARLVASSVAVLLATAGLVAAPDVGFAAAGEVLILGDTVSGGASSIEAQEVAALGLTPVVVDSGTWSTKSTSDFASYRAIVLGDATCSGTVPAAAVGNAAVWGAAITGNVLINGTDPVYHANQGGEAVTRRAIDFSVSNATKTGLYASLSCYYHDTAPKTAVTLLDALQPGGFTVTGVGCYNDAHVVATHPALDGLTDATLSNWGCSVHEAFDTWPASFTVLAMAKDFGSAFTASDGTVGTPYMLASGSGLKSFPLSVDPISSKAEVGTTQTLTATLLDSATRLPVSGVLLRASAAAATGVSVGASLACSTPLCTTNASGQVAFSYSRSAVTNDVVTVWNDSNVNNLIDVGEAQVRAAVEWVPATAKPVLMIHGIDLDPRGGWSGNCSGSWNDLKKYLRSNGFADRDLLTIGYYVDDTDCDRSINDAEDPAVGNEYFNGKGAHSAGSSGHTPEAAIEHLGYHFAWWIYDNYSKHGVHVDVVAHSMGGLITRFALGKVQAGAANFPPKLYVDNVVTLGTPHGGSRPGLLGRVCGLRECSQMAPGDGFLTSLERDAWNPQGAGGTDWTSLGSDADNAVTADRAVGTSRDRKTDQYFGGCHKVWYSNLEHSDYMHVGADKRTAWNFATYSNPGRCGAPLSPQKGQRPPVPMIALALASESA